MNQLLINRPKQTLEAKKLARKITEHIELTAKTAFDFDDTDLGLSLGTLAEARKQGKAREFAQVCAEFLEENLER